jgi:glycosyltransferase involved in cell wall biosynthesis
MSVLEAMAAAVPVVVTRTCPWSDVERHEAGYWVEQNPAAIGDALVRILNDPDRARAMGERGRALAERTYRWDAIARAFTEQYCDVRALSSSGVALPALS